jgi:hypothetical protein
MSRRRTLGTKKKIALLVSAAAVAGGGAFALASTSNAAQSPPGARTLSAADGSTVCQGLATALGNNERFIAGQQASPDSQSAARIANRQAVIAQIKVQQKASGCTVGESAQGSQSGQGGDAQAGSGQQGGNAQQGAGQQAGTGEEGGAGQQAGAGQQVCKGSTVTLSGEGGAPAASSNQFPAGTTLKVTSVSGSCVLLNNSAFEQVRESGKFLIRRALIGKVG